MPTFEDKLKEFRERNLTRIKARDTKVEAYRAQLIVWFQKLKDAHIWFRKEVDIKTDEAKYNKGVARVEEIYNELEKLKVDKTFSASLFVNNPDLSDYLVNQFDDNVNSEEEKAAEPYYTKY